MSLGAMNSPRPRPFEYPQVSKPAREEWCPIRTLQNIAGLGNFYSQSGGEFGFDFNRIDNGLIVLTHGMRSNGRAQWLTDLRNRIEEAISIKQQPGRTE